MSFCKECENYISLYIDNLLDEKESESFFEHLKECSQCEQKYKEAILINQLCKESNEDIKLPEEFSVSLHEKLVKISEEQSNNKKKLFLYNKKLIAGLSTAAVLVVSLLAYNLLPHVGIKTETASIADKAPSKQSTSAKYDSSTDKSNINSNEGIESASITDAGPSTQAKQAAAAVSPVITYSESKTPAAGIRSKELPSPKASNNTAEPDSQNSGSTMRAFFNVNDKKFYINTAQLTLQISVSSAEEDVLKKVMQGLGAESTTPSAISGIEKTNSQEYIDYNLTLDKYYKLVNEEAQKNKLSLTIKNDVISKDVTETYNQLNTQKGEIEKKIEEAKSVGEETAELQTEANEISAKINDIIVKNDMISVRIFIVR